MFSGELYGYLTIALQRPRGPSSAHRPAEVLTIALHGATHCKLRRRARASLSCPFVGCMTKLERCSTSHPTNITTEGCNIPRTKGSPTIGGMPRRRQPSAHLSRRGAGLCMCVCVCAWGRHSQCHEFCDWCFLTSAEKKGERERTQRAYLITRSQERTARSLIPRCKYLYIQFYFPSTSSSRLPRHDTNLGAHRPR